MLSIDLTNRRALVAGVADDAGYGFAIAKALAEAGATICVATWPPALNIFTSLLERGKMDESRALAGGGTLDFEKIYPLDAAYDTLADAPAEIRGNKRYKDTDDFSIEGLASRLRTDFGDKSVDIVIHSLANGPEVKKPLLDTSRSGYLTAVGVSAYSLVSTASRLAPLMRPDGSFLSLTYMASERVIPGYGRGMSSAKPALERATRTPAVQPGRTRRERHRHHRQNGRVLRRELSIAAAAHRRRGGCLGRFSLERAGERHHRRDGVRRQGLSRDGHGGHEAVAAVAGPAAAASCCCSY